VDRTDKEGSGGKITFPLLFSYLRVGVLRYLDILEGKMFW
jgi:hypothetical protein